MVFGERGISFFTVDETGGIVCAQADFYMINYTDVYVPFVEEWASVYNSYMAIAESGSGEKLFEILFEKFDIGSGE